MVILLIFNNKLNHDKHAMQEQYWPMRLTHPGYQSGSGRQIEGAKTSILAPKSLQLDRSIDINDRNTHSKCSHNLHRLHHTKTILLECNRL